MIMSSGPEDKCLIEKRKHNVNADVSCISNININS